MCKEFIELTEVKGHTRHGEANYGNPLDWNDGFTIFRQGPDRYLTSYIQVTPDMTSIIYNGRAIIYKTGCDCRACSMQKAWLLLNLPPACEPKAKKTPRSRRQPRLV